MGIVLGCMIACIAMGRVHDVPRPDVLVRRSPSGITVLFIIVAGCTVGSMLPIVLKRFGIDPATSSTPFIASLVDTVGVVIYAHVAMFVMHDVIRPAQAPQGARASRRRGQSPLPPPSRSR